MDGKKIMYISEEVSKEEGDGEKGVQGETCGLFQALPY